MIPPTAPLIDVFGRQPSAARPTWQPTLNASSAMDPLEMTPAPPPHRPLAQPLPGRPQPPRNAPMPEAIPVRPATPRPARAVPAPAPPPPSFGSAESAGGSWLTFLLVGVVAVSGVALALYTLARPFLPAGWTL